MKAVRSRGDGSVSVLDAGEPTGAGMHDPVIVHVRSSGICGTDLHLVDMALPVILGHEFAGVLDDGTAVAVQPGAVCGVCDQCLREASHRCRTVVSRLHGVSIDGGLAERVAVERSCLLPLPTGVDPANTAIAEPIAVGVRALVEVGLGPGATDRILVVGGGSIGLALASVARFWGIEVDLVARHARRPRSRRSAWLRIRVTTGIRRDRGCRRHAKRSR